MVERLRNEKREFIRKSFHKAVDRTIEIALASTLKKIKKSNQIRMAEMLKESKRCMNILCNGKLDEKSECITCAAKFCTKCDKRIIPDSDHVCNPDDIVSIETVSGLVKCPKCKCPVIKSVGCNAITCAVCRTNFDYITGKPCSAGNHTNDAALGLKDATTLVSVYGSEYDDPNIADMFAKIDSMRPSDYSFSNVTSVIQDFMKLPPEQSETQKKKLAHVLAVKYTRFIKNKYEIREFHRCIEKIEEFHNKKEMTIGNLQSIVNFLEM
jgi:hypothetical protein